MSDSSTASPFAAAPAPLSERLMSLDALRGFDMLWILGADALFKTFDLLHSTKTTKFISEQLTHVKWDGFVFYDLIFPLFVFIAGVSVVFSLTKQLEKGGRAAAIRRLFIRASLLFLLGIFYHQGIAKTFADVRILGVLQRIALSYFFAATLFCFFRTRGLIVAALILLVGYWALMSFVPVPGQPEISFAEGKNLANYLDSKYLPCFKWDGNHDPEGLLSTLPAIATCLLGVLAGLLLKNPNIKPYVKVLTLLVAGAIGVAAGLAWGDPNIAGGYYFPVIKKLWTSSFVLVAGGYSAILLGLFYLVLDVWKLRFWAAPFVWVGMNAITLYIINNIMYTKTGGGFNSIARRFVAAFFQTKNAQGDVVLCPPPLGTWGLFVINLTAVLLVVALAHFLYKRKIFLRV